MAVDYKGTRKEEERKRKKWIECINQDMGEKRLESNDVCNKT